MNEKEIMAKFDELFGIMAQSNDVRMMRLFGGVMRRMMSWVAKNTPSRAMEYIEQLCAVKWRNYLTQEEAEAIVAKMQPSPKWKYSEWKNEMEHEAIPLRDEPYYNEYALYVEMCKQYSDSANTIATLMGKSVSEVTYAEWMKALNMLAVDLLKDEDEKYNIRNYFFEM